MPREARLRWSKVAGAYRSDVGPKSEKTGRPLPVYFRRDAEGNKIGRGDRRKAAEMLAAHLEQRDRERNALRPDLDNPPVWQVVEIYLLWCEEQVAKDKLDARTYKDRVDALKRFQEFASDRKTKNGLRRARTMTARDLSRWRDSLAEATEDVKGRPLDGYGGHFITRYMSGVKSCWSWAADPEREPAPILRSDPFAGVAGPEMDDAPERYVDEAQADALLAFIDKHAERYPADSITGRFERLTALLYRCIYESGCRPSELVKAQWTEFNPEGRVISYVPRRHKTGKKTKRPRRIGLSQSAVDLLVKERDRPGRHPLFIFTHKRGRGAAERGALDPEAGEPWKVSALGQKFLKLRRLAKEKLGLDILVRDGAGQVVAENPEMTMYDFRRTFTTDAREAGVDPADAASAQGHSREIAERVYDANRIRRATGVTDTVGEHRQRLLKDKEKDK